MYGIVFDLVFMSFLSGCGISRIMPFEASIIAEDVSRRSFEVTSSSTIPHISVGAWAQEPKQMLYIGF